MLAEGAFELSRLDLITREREQATSDGLRRLEEMARRRLAGEPVARILREQEFYGLPFRLVAETLVPRPETELLVDFAIAVLTRDEPVRILDLGTGTGCIAIAVLANLPNAHAVAVDLSDAAIACARDNAARNGVQERFEGRVGSWFEPLQADESFDLILSNPPYIESSVIATLQPEVREFDPGLALDGGPDGLNAYRAIVGTSMRHLRAGGWIGVEIGSAQGEAVRNLFSAARFSNLSVKKDLAGLDRMVVGHHVGQVNGPGAKEDQYFPLGKSRQTS